jgi:hypothetical protein
MHERIGIVAKELSNLPNVDIIVGDLTDKALIDELFREPVHLAFINTTHWGNEYQIGRSLVDAAKRAGVEHLIFSSMPDHSVFGQDWQALPLWSPKYAIENYIRQTGMQATYIYCGIYHNNFTSLPYPLFRMELQDDDSFEWKAPFNPDEPLPWLDAEHDVGPVVLQIFKDGPQKWAGQRYVQTLMHIKLGCIIALYISLTSCRIPLAFEYLTPLEVCDAFSRALDRPVTYIRGSIDIEISIPKGYREHLQILEENLGRKEAPYFGPDLEPHCTRIAQQLWEGNRSIEEYAREVFPVEESANGLTWMDEGDEPNREVELDFKGLTF